MEFVTPINNRGATPGATCSVSTIPPEGEPGGGVGEQTFYPIESGTGPRIYTPNEGTVVQFAVKKIRATGSYSWEDELDPDNDGSVQFNEVFEYPDLTGGENGQGHLACGGAYSFFKFDPAQFAAISGSFGVFSPIQDEDPDELYLRFEMGVSGSIPHSTGTSPTISTEAGTGQFSATHSDAGSLGGSFKIFRATTPLTVTGGQLSLTVLEWWD